jgi:hypothetical protein
MTEADLQRLLASEKIRRVAPDREMARAEIDVACVDECRSRSAARLVRHDLGILCALLRSWRGARGCSSR